jgi:hypothetical protein
MPDEARRNPFGWASDRYKSDKKRVKNRCFRGIFISLGYIFQKRTTLTNLLTKPLTYGKTKHYTEYPTQSLALLPGTVLCCAYGSPKKSDKAAASYGKKVESGRVENGNNKIFI